jgi:hypothetical protein
LNFHPKNIGLFHLQTESKNWVGRDQNRMIHPVASFILAQLDHFCKFLLIIFRMDHNLSAVVSLSCSDFIKMSSIHGDHYFQYY